MAARLLGAALLVLVFASDAPATQGPWTRGALAARAALHRSAKAGYISRSEERRYLGILNHARVVHSRVPPLRAQILEAVVDEVAGPRSPTRARALQLYTTLQENVDYLDVHRIPADGTDVTGPDGAVYRFFSGEGFQFHPLANAAQLNMLVAAHDDAAARTLVDALAARAERRPDGSLVWEYWFDFGGERAPWTSGMAQAVLAQALARIGDLELARNAYDAIPGKLDVALPAGPWIRLYSHSSLIVLNAQLQSAISIGDYGDLAQDPGARALANRLLAAAKAMLPRFDTGHWTRYSLGEESTLSYQNFVISLLKLLATRTGDPVWSDAAQRFADYETQPPLMTSAKVTRVVYPRPNDGVRDDFLTSFFLSKPSQVVLVIDGEAVEGHHWSGGQHGFSWPARQYGFGTHRVRLVARGVDGTPGATELGNFEVARDRTPPRLATGKGHGKVYWHAKDGESACCRIHVILRGKGGSRVLYSRHSRSSAGVPKGRWSVTVVALDAAGNRSEKSVGLVSRR